MLADATLVFIICEKNFFNGVEIVYVFPREVVSTSVQQALKHIVFVTKPVDVILSKRSRDVIDMITSLLLAKVPITIE